MEALRWQNGLEASYTRGVFHALGRYGVQRGDVLRRHRAAPRRRRSRAAAEERARRRSTSRWSAPRRTRWRPCCDRVRHGTLPDVGRAPTRWCSRRRRWRRTSPRRSHAGRSSARRCARTPTATSKALVLRGARARLVGEVADRLSGSLRCCAGRVGCWRSPSSPTWPSAIRSIAWHPVRLIGRHADVDRRAAAARRRSTATAAASLLFVAAGAGLARRRRRRSLVARRCASPWLAWLVHVVPALQPARARRSAAPRLADRARGARAAICDGARAAVSALVGRDTDRMDGAACRRAAVESLSENLTDGFVSPLFWYVVGRPAGTRAVQGRQHDGLDGRLQDAAVSAGSAGAARGSTT